MKISECMKQKVRNVSAQDTLRRVAESMAEIDGSSLPAGEYARLIGIVSIGDLAHGQTRRAGKRSATLPGRVPCIRSNSNGIWVKRASYRAERPECAWPQPRQSG